MFTAVPNGTSVPAGGSWLTTIVVSGLRMVPITVGSMPVAHRVLSIPASFAVGVIWSCRPGAIPGPRSLVTGISAGPKAGGMGLSFLSFRWG